MKWNAAQQKKIMDSVRGWHELNSDLSNRISKLHCIAHFKRSDFSHTTAQTEVQREKE